jgi:hypothetical protein
MKRRYLPLTGKEFEAIRNQLSFEQSFFSSKKARGAKKALEKIRFVIIIRRRGNEVIK